MMDFFEKTISFGFGLFAYTKEKVEVIVEELVSKGEIAKKDAQQFASDLVKKGEEQRDELKKLIKNEVSDAMSRLNILKRDEYVTKDEIVQIVREQINLVLEEQGITKKENQ